MLYYPEENHMPSEQACQSFNSRIMKHLMKQKMQKNDTFYVSKVLKGDNHFLRRQSSGQNRLPQVNTSQQNMRAVNRLSKLPNKQLIRSTPDLLAMDMSQSRSILDNSRMNNHNSTAAAVD